MKLGRGHSSSIISSLLREATWGETLVDFSGHFPTGMGAQALAADRFGSFMQFSSRHKQLSWKTRLVVGKGKGEEWPTRSNDQRPRRISICGTPPKMFVASMIRF
jgi:hypothetical protein